MEAPLPSSTAASTPSPPPPPSGAVRPRHKLTGAASRPTKRRCVSSACIACRRRKSKCDGNTPSCAACASVYHTECVYDLNSDHRRKGVYKKDIDNLKTQNGTLQTLIEAILNYPEDKVFDLVREIRSCDSLEELAERIAEEQKQIAEGIATGSDKPADGDSPASQSSIWAGEDGYGMPASLEAELSGKLGALRLEEGQVRFIGATSNLMLLPATQYSGDEDLGRAFRTQRQDMPVLSWTNVTQDKDLILHLITLYFTYHYPFFTTLSKDLFYKEFFRGRQASDPRRIDYCTPILVNIMLALGCHFTTWPGARANPEDPATAGDHFFKEAKRLILENDEHENPCLTTVQALALMSVREAGCGREAKGWVYSGMSFRMAMDLGLHLDPAGLKETDSMSDEEIDARRITFWGCFLFDKCWSNYMGRMPQLPSAMVTVPKPDVFPSEDSDNWVPYTDDGIVDSAQPSRIRAISLQISQLCEISNDILLSFYNPTPHSSSPVAKSLTKSTLTADFKKLGDLFSRLEEWRKKLPPELEPRGGSLPSALLMHMFHQTLYIHLFRPFLKFSKTTPLSHLDPRKACLHAATNISKYLRFYKHRYKLKQICNVAGYFLHTACTIHLLNLPQKTAARDIVQGLQGLEEMGECWPVARRSLVIIDILVRRWQLEIPGEAATILARSRLDAKRWGLQDKGRCRSHSPRSERSDIFFQQQAQVGAGGWQGVQGEQWLLRDQGELGMELQGLGEMGWEGEVPVPVWGEGVWGEWPPPPTPRDEGGVAAGMQWGKGGETGG
ncbi:fungal-specific transcription factor domain-containing protein [Sphaerosporella brunnea]|uniref:Fungal-specific transcription factor domain-containing protein n=1 Tax=Sphaerosporella brunnea TaxID=1250544 RepID=A0A5J5ECL7_9PEZI|nr:fungal-specific transcription factor domain-containing protein [Sphaerosporella brunnea]